MPSTYTTNLGIEKPATGEQSGTWGATVNTNYDMFDQAIAGLVSVTLPATGSSGSPNDLPVTDGAVSDGRNAFIEFVDGGDLGGDAYVQMTPNDAERLVWVRNSLSANRSIYVFQGTYNASNDYVLAVGETALLRFDGAGAGAVVTPVMDSVILQALQVDNINIDGNTISSTAGTDLNITPLAGQQIVLDGTVVIDAGVVTGVTTLNVETSASFGDTTLTTDGQFYAGAVDAATPIINWDSSDYIGYNRTNDDWNFYIGGVSSLKITSTDNYSEVPLKIKESAAAAGDTAGYGQLWVRNDTPNTLHFTDDAGSDFPLIEYGVFVPSLSDGTNTATASATGYWSRIGNVVTVYGYLALSSKGSISGALRINNSAPYGINAILGGTLTIGVCIGASITAGVTITAWGQPSSNYFNLSKWSATTGTANLTDADVTDSFQIQYTGSYVVT